VPASRNLSQRRALLAQRDEATAQIAALEREFADIAAAASAEGADDEHDPEGATLAYERQHAAALLSRAHDQVAEIDAALARLAAGSYGLCASCGQRIDPDRLAARPTATACITCAGARRR
jgi:DnaK suppressor protein